jgi:hypothetical protein
MTSFTTINNMESTMPNFIKTISLCLIGMMTAVAHAEEITESDVRHVIARIDSAIEQTDAEALGNELSENAEITLNFVEQGENQVMKLSKEEYLHLLKQGWAQFSDYSYRRSDLKIKLQGAKAHISAIVHEQMAVDGEQYSASSHEEATIELIDGNPIVTTVIGHTGL